MLEQKIIVVTLLRKGSKRAPNKNIKPYLGKPLYQHTVNTARHLELPYYVITDYEKEEIPLSYGIYARVPAKFCQDKHISNETIKWFLAAAEIECDYVVLLQATSPKRDAGHMQECINDFTSSTLFDCGLYVKKIEDGFFYASGNHVYDKFERDYNGRGKAILQKETGGFYIFKTRMLNKNHVTNGFCKLYNDPYGIDIDFEEDFE